MDESASWDTRGLTQSPCKQVPVLKVCRGAFTLLKRPVLVVGTRFHFSIHQARAIPKGFSNANFRNQQCQKKQGQKSQLLCENISSLNIQFLANKNLTFSFPIFRRHKSCPNNTVLMTQPARLETCNKYRAPSTPYQENFLPDFSSPTCETVNRARYCRKSR